MPAITKYVGQPCDAAQNHTHLILSNLYTLLQRHVVCEQ